MSIASFAAPTLAIFPSSQFDFIINLRAARVLGLALPPDFVSAANEVIE